MSPNEITGYRGDYGTLSLPPSDEARSILSSMTDLEKFNFNNLLVRLQGWHESVAQEHPLHFHPEARASLWGAALAKIADHYQDVGRNDRALFFMRAAWTLSKYPIFAYNTALLLLSVDASDIINAGALLQTYLAEYRKVLTSPVLRLVNPEVAEEELERIAQAARARLVALDGQAGGSPGSRAKGGTA